jgi:hypothetical protein
MKLGFGVSQPYADLCTVLYRKIEPMPKNEYPEALEISVLKLYKLVP